MIREGLHSDEADGCSIVSSRAQATTPDRMMERKREVLLTCLYATSPIRLR